MNALVIELPQPISANRMWRQNRRTGRIFINPLYAEWKRAALSHMWTQKPAGGFPFFAGKFRMEIVLPVKIRPDEDNLVKPLGDFLEKTARIVANDKHMFGHEISRSDEINKGFCRVVLTEWPNDPS